LSSRRCISIHTYVTTFLIYCFLTCNCAAFAQSELNWTALTIFHGYWQFYFNKRTWCDLLLMSLSMCFRLWFVIILFLLCFLFYLCNWPYRCYANKLIIRKLNLTELKSHQFTWVRERVFFTSLYAGRITRYTGGEPGRLTCHVIIRGRRAITTAIIISNLSDDRSKVSSKTIPPLNAI
jgi:hypothetical protein